MLEIAEKTSICEDMKNRVEIHINWNMEEMNSLDEAGSRIEMREEGQWGHRKQSGRKRSLRNPWKNTQTPIICVIGAPVKQEDRLRTCCNIQIHVVHMFTCTQIGDWLWHPVFRDGSSSITISFGFQVIISCYLRVQREPGKVTPCPQRMLVTRTDWPQVTISYKWPWLHIWECGWKEN